ncbi:MAG: LamG domain-containing protein, partial [Planctomycetes bacterium]|nr:LamG domain-containing protein [Planctomycetota bacterium]
KERKQFDVSGLVIESDGKVTLQVFTNQDIVTERFRSKENTDNDVQPGENGPTLTVIYDPNIAYAYGIADGATGVHPRPTLSWKTGPTSTSSTVYFGTSENDLTLGSWTIAGNGNMSLDLAASLGYDLTVGDTYYWQIVSTIPGGDGDGDVFSFTVMDTHPDVPILQAPDGGTLVLPIDLSWAASENATGYDLSIGTDPTAVTNFSAAVIAVGNVLTVQTADLDLETTYYWTVRGTHPSQGPWPAAEVFSFTTDNYEVLDDFEAGIGSWTAGGGTAGISVGTIVDNGSGSLQLDFDDTSAVSTATLGLASRDLTSGGRAALRLSYHGIETNSDEQTLYVSINGSVAKSYEVMEDIQEYSWKGWDKIHLDLGDFTGAGLDAVTQLTIGIGEGSGGETGTLFIDDVRLYVQQCVPSTVPGYFIGGDCYADEPNELLALSERWLAGPVDIDAASAPPLDDTLLLHFTFDEDANDVYYSNTSAIGETLAVVGDGAPKWGQPSAPIPGGGISSIHVSSADSITIVSPDLSSADTSATLSMWVKGDLLTDQVKANGKLPQRELLRISTTDNAQYWKVLWPNAGGSVKAQGGGGADNNAVPDDFQLIWRHLAIVRDGDNSTAAFYVDGVKVAQDGFWLSDDTVVNPFPGPDVTEIPIPRNNQFDGHIDEFRFYGSALSQAEIIWLANLSDVSQPVLGTGPDTNNDGSFDYEDLADLAEVWYKEVLFPPTP